MTRRKIQGVPTRELWNVQGAKKKQAHIVVRDDKGRYISHTKIKGSKMTIQKARIALHERGTLKKLKEKKIYKTETNLKNLREIVELTDTKPQNRSKPVGRKPRGKIMQYVVQGYYKNSLIVGRSQKIGEAFAQNARQAKDNAWNNFLLLLSQKAVGGYDEDEGLKYIDKVKNLREGWVQYKKVKSS